MLDTLVNVKMRMGIAGTQYDSFLTNQITLISDVIEAYCRRKFLEATYIQTFYKEDYAPVRQFDLYHYPVSVVAAIHKDGEEVPLDEYRFHKPTGRVTSLNGGSFFYNDETEVEYTAGYVTCPTPILAVMDALISERYNKKINGIDLNFGSDVQRISIPGAISIDFDYSLSNNDRKSAYGSILGSNVNILDDWRSERTIIGSGHLEYVEDV